MFRYFVELWDGWYYVLLCEGGGIFLGYGNSKKEARYNVINFACDIWKGITS